MNFKEEKWTYGVALFVAESDSSRVEEEDKLKKSHDYKSSEWFQIRFSLSFYTVFSFHIFLSGMYGLTCKFDM